MKKGSLEILISIAIMVILYVAAVASGIKVDNAEKVRLEPFRSRFQVTKQVGQLDYISIEEVIDTETGQKFLMFKGDRRLAVVKQ